MGTLVGLAILSILFTIGLPVVVIIVIVRLVTHRSQNGKPGTGMSAPISQLTPRQTTLGITAVAAAYAGIAAFYVLPTWLLGETEDGTIFMVRLVSGLLLLAAGLGLLRYRLVSILLMTVGVVTMLMASPYIFQNFGSGGVLVVIFIVLAALIGLAIRLSHKEKAV